jgi:hypothetical protein
MRRRRPNVNLRQRPRIGAWRSGKKQVAMEFATPGKEGREERDKKTLASPTFIGA